MGVTNFDAVAAQRGTFEELAVGSGDVVGYQSHYFNAYIAGAQTTGTSKVTLLVPAAGTLTGIQAYLGTAPTDADFLLDINKNGTTVTPTKPKIVATEHALATTLDVAVAAGDRITIDIDQVGSDVAGSDLSIALTFRYPN